jgi:hypothetical protein
MKHGNHRGQVHCGQDLLGDGLLVDERDEAELGVAVRADDLKKTALSELSVAHAPSAGAGSIPPPADRRRVAGARARASAWGMRRSGFTWRAPPHVLP